MSEVVRVCELAEQLRGVSYGKSDASSTPRPGYLPVLRAGNITEDGLTFDDLVFVPAEHISAKQKIRRNDVVIAASSGSLSVVGKAARALNDYEGGFGAFCKVLRPGPDVDPAYFAHFFRTQQYRQRVSALAAGININNLRNEHLDGIQIPIPPLREQRRIAEILDTADALRAKRRAALAQLDTLTQSIFLDMFGDPATNPKGWPRPSLIRLLETAEVFVDGDWVESKDQDPDGDVRLIQLADVGDGTYLDKSSRFLTSDTAHRLKCMSLQVGDILIARMPDPLGRACLFPGDARKAVTVVDICIIRPGSQGPHPTWLMCCINTTRFRSLIAREATGTTRSRISRGNLSRLPIIAPPLALQRKFARRVEAVTRLRERSVSAETQCGSLFSSLQHRAFRGEL